MQQSRLLKHAVRVGALGLGLLVVVAPMSVRAQDEGAEETSSIWNLEKRVWDGFIHGLGLRSGDEPVINYRERSPLVVPPTRDLPPPQAKSAAKNSAWPHDPDAVRRQQRSKKSQAAGSNDTSRVVDRQGSPIAPDQLTAPGASATASTASGPPPTGAAGEGKNMLPSELGYFGGLFSASAWGFGFHGYRDEVGTFTAEPSRDALTAPPVGYQTPSATQPYGVTKRVERSAPRPFDPAGN